MWANAIKGLFIVLYLRSLTIITFIIREATPATAELARINAKERQGRRAKKRKGIEAQRAKPPTPTRAIDVLIRDDEQKKKKQGAAPQSSYPGPFGHLDYMVSLFF